jgi:hypothetical protein
VHDLGWFRGVLSARLGVVAISIWVALIMNEGEGCGIHIIRWSVECCTHTLFIITKGNVV